MSFTFFSAREGVEKFAAQCGERGSVVLPVHRTSIAQQRKGDWSGKTFQTTYRWFSCGRKWQYNIPGKCGIVVLLCVCVHCNFGSISSVRFVLWFGAETLCYCSRRGFSYFYFTTVMMVLPFAYPELVIKSWALVTFWNRNSALSDRTICNRNAEC